MPLTDQQKAGISLVTFTFQNAAFVLLMRQSKVMNTGYNSTVAVLMMEILKLPLTTGLLVFEKASVSAAGAQLWQDIVLHPMDTLKARLHYLSTVSSSQVFRSATTVPLVGDFALLRSP